ncbi:MAG: hypothetical protein NTZ35_19270 [Ignavibacteriales bacterium]|nr:hypothetical protein [Ignavibacteriales bacterium]
MIRLLGLCGLVSTTLFPIIVVAQMLGGDPNFPVLNEIRWEMRTSEIQSLCNNKWRETSSTDSTMVYNSSFFGASAKTMIQVDPKSKQPRMINIGFEQATSAMRDTLLNHFALITGKPPVITTKEKNAIIFTLKFEMALWKTGKETVGVMTAMRGSSIVALSLILTPLSLAQK